MCIVHLTLSGSVRFVKCRVFFFSKANQFIDEKREIDSARERKWRRKNISKQVLIKINWMNRKRGASFMFHPRLCWLCLVSLVKRFCSVRFSYTNNRCRGQSMIEKLFHIVINSWLIFWCCYLTFKLSIFFLPQQFTIKQFIIELLWCEHVVFVISIVCHADKLAVSTVVKLSSLLLSSRAKWVAIWNIYSINIHWYRIAWFMDHCMLAPNVHNKLLRKNF